MGGAYGPDGEIFSYGFDVFTYEVKALYPDFEKAKEYFNGQPPHAYKPYFRERLKVIFND